MPPSNNAGNVVTLLCFSTRTITSTASTTHATAHPPPPHLRHHPPHLLHMYSSRSLLAASWAAERGSWPHEHAGTWRCDAAPHEGSRGTTPSIDGGEVELSMDMVICNRGSPGLAAGRYRARSSTPTYLATSPSVGAMGGRKFRTTARRPDLLLRWPPPGRRQGTLRLTGAATEQPPL
jgi:hypothetical protein